MNDNFLIKTLLRHGLNENEIKVYCEAVKHEEISPFKLSKLVGVPRTTVYDVMTGLALKGLITIKQNGPLEKQQTSIRAKNPSILREQIFERREELNRLENDILDVLPVLKGEFLQDKANADFQFYPGINGARMVMGQTPENKHSNVYYFDQLLPMDTFGKKKVNLDVDTSLKWRRVHAATIRTIIPWTRWTRHVLAYQYGRNKNFLKLYNFRFIDQKAFSLNVDMFVVEDKVRVICAKDDEAWGLIVNSPLFAGSIKAIFSVVWNLATPVTEELVASLGRDYILK